MKMIQSSQVSVETQTLPPSEKKKTEVGLFCGLRVRVSPFHTRLLLSVGVYEQEAFRLRRKRACCLTAALEIRVVYRGSVYLSLSKYVLSAGRQIIDVGFSWSGFIMGYF